MDEPSADPPFDGPLERELEEVPDDWRTWWRWRGDGEPELIVRPFSLAELDALEREWRGEPVHELEPTRRLRGDQRSREFPTLGPGMYWELRPRRA